jgi:hypothetical protein
MSIILSQEKKMLQLGYKLQEVIWQRIKAQTESNQSEQAKSSNSGKPSIL